MKDKIKNEQYIVKSVLNALDLLDAFICKEEEFGVGELSRKLDIPKNKVFRLLTTLSEKGYIEQNEVTEKYRLGLKAFELGQSYKRRLAILKIAHPILTDLSSSFDESVYMAILDKQTVVYIDMVETTKPLRIIPHLGWRTPAYCTAIGKIQLAYKDVDEIVNLLERAELKPFTKKTITDKKKLLKHLQEIAYKGFALDNEEFEEGVKCVAVPVRDYHNTVVAGVCVSGPAIRMSDRRIKNKILDRLMMVSREISQKLGYLGA